MREEISVVFLVDNYFPKFSPVAKCAYNIADELSKNFDVSIITLDSNNSMSITEKHKDQKIIRCTTKAITNRRKLEKSISNNDKNYISRISLTGLRAKGYLDAMFSKANIKEDIVKSYSLALEKLNPEVLIPVSLPFESVVASMRYKDKNSNVVLIPFLFDRFTYNNSLHKNRINLKIKEKFHIYLEEQMLLYSDHIFAMHQLKDNYDKIFHGDFTKFSFVEHPLLKETILPKRQVCDDRIRLLYAGALYKKYRSPKYLLDIFRKLGSSFLLTFFSAGNCESMIERYSEIDKRISRNGYVTVDVLEQEYSNADVLVSIGNFKSQNMTSKIFEYMAISKPIIHFYVNKEDPVLNILRKYPLALLVEQTYNDIEVNVKRIKEFCENNKSKVEVFNNIADIYYDALPSVISHQFKEIIITQIALRKL